MRMLNAVVVLVSVGVLTPLASGELLTNGSFEDGLNGWNTTHATLDPNQYLPHPDHMDGNHHAGDQNGIARNDSNWQSIDVTGEVELTGYLAGGDGGGYLYWVRLLDGGGVDGPLLSEFSLYGVNDWTPFELYGMASGSVTVEFGATGDAIYGPAAYHIDTLVLTPEPTSLTLCAFAGLTMFLGRPRRC